MHLLCLLMCLVCCGHSCLCDFLCWCVFGVYVVVLWHHVGVHACFYFITSGNKLLMGGGSGKKEEQYLKK